MAKKKQQPEPYNASEYLTDCVAVFTANQNVAANLVESDTFNRIVIDILKSDTTTFTGWKWAGEGPALPPGYGVDFVFDVALPGATPFNDEYDFLNVILPALEHNRIKVIDFGHDAGSLQHVRIKVIQH